MERTSPEVTASSGILVAGIGNIFFSDDGFGPEAVRRLLADARGLPEDVRVEDYGIRGMHLAYDLLDGYDALVLIDAIPGDGVPGEVKVLEIGPDDIGDGEFDAHGMNPVAVLASLESLGGSLPPTYIIGCSPVSVDEGLGLSGPVEAAIPIALDALRRLIDETVIPRVRTTGAAQQAGS